MTSLNLLVIRANDPSTLVSFYSQLGLDFVEEKHESGPTHFSCNIGGSVFEIYPLGKNSQPTTGTRLGFGVPSLRIALRNLKALDSSKVIQPPQETAWGITAIVADPEGHKVELREASSPSEP